jgi:hypothetical protein
MSRKKKNKHNHKDKAQENAHTNCEPKLDTDNVDEKSKVEDEGTIESPECEKDSAECDTHTLLEQTRKDLDEARADSIE